MGRRILVVDDEESTAFFLRENLAELGPQYHVEIATSGEDAIYKIAVQPYDLVITDLRMPGLSGLELLKWIRKACPKTHLILMTAYGSNEVETQARRLEIYRYITKPFRVEDLLDAVRQVIGGQVLSRQGMLVLSDTALEAMTRRLDQLRAEIGPQCIILADVMGQLITHSGETSTLEVDTLISLIGGGFATTFEVARYLRQSEAFNLNYQEGNRYDIYTSNVGENLFLTIIYQKAIQTSRIGLVWLYTRRAVTDLLRLLSSAKMDEAGDLLSSDFETLLQREMDEVFGGESGDNLYALTEQFEQAALAPTVPTPQPGQASPPERDRRTVRTPRPMTPAEQSERQPFPGQVRTPQPVQPTSSPAEPEGEEANLEATQEEAPPASSRRDVDQSTYSLEEAHRMGLIDDDLLRRMLGRRNAEHGS